MPSRLMPITIARLLIWKTQKLIVPSIEPAMNAPVGTNVIRTWKMSGWSCSVTVILPSR